LIRTIATCEQPVEVLTALDTVSLKHPQRLRVHGFRFIPSWAFNPQIEHVDRDIFFGPDLGGEEYWSEYRKLAKASGGSVLADYSRTVSAPFTLTEGMRTLQPRGDAFWPFDLLKKFSVRDGLCCPLRRWGIWYCSTRPLRIEVEAEDRYLLGMAAAIAAQQLERITHAHRTSEVAELSAREKLVLRERALGNTVSETAQYLHLSDNTVRTYTRRIIKKLGARNITHAVHLAYRAAAL